MTKRTLLKFQSPSCVPCKALSTTLALLQQEQPELFQELTLSEINTDSERDLVIAHGVRSVPTLVLLGSTGEELRRLTGSSTANKLKEFLK